MKNRTNQLYGEKLFNKLKNVLQEKNLYKEKYIERLRNQCDSIDFYEARFLDKYKQFIKIIKQNKPVENNNLLIFYLLGLSDFDPIHIQPEIIIDGQIDLVDVDEDFQHNRRDDVIKFIKERFGEDKVKQIIVYQMAKTRAIIQDVAGALEIPPQQTFAVTKQIASNAALQDKSLEQLQNLFPTFKSYLNKYPKVRYFASKMRGMVRNFGCHACGIIISSVNLNEYIPLLKVGDNIITSWQQGTGSYGLKHVGLVKFDILGLSNVTILKYALDNINKRRGTNYTVENLPINDKKTLQLFYQGNTDNIFQLESGTAKNILKMIKPDCFEDIAAVSAILRPGPLMAGVDKQYAQNKASGQYQRYGNDVVDSVLDSTYGNIIYQQQVMKLALIAGFSASESNKFRKVLVKYRDWGDTAELRRQKIDVHKNKFIKGLSKYIKEHQAQDLFEKSALFATYAFNKSHCLSYSLLSYAQGFCKANYPIQFIKAVLDFSQNADKIQKNTMLCQQMGIKLVNPNINKSELGFTIIDDNTIAYGLNSLKGIKPPQAETIILNRPYSSLQQFMQKTQITNKLKIQSLIFSSAFDDFGDIEKIYNEFHKSRLKGKKKQEYQNKQFSFFELHEAQAASMSMNIKYSSFNVLDKLRKDLQLDIGEKIYLPSQLDFEQYELEDKEYILAIKQQYTAKISKTSKKPMGILKLSDDIANIEIFVWQNSLEKVSNIENSSILILKIGRFENSDTKFFQKLVYNCGKIDECC